MFNGQVDKKVIAETSGKCLKALGSFEHTCEEKLQDISRVATQGT